MKDCAYRATFYDRIIFIYAELENQLDVEKLLKKLNGPDHQRKRSAGLRARIGEEIALPLRGRYPGIQIKDISEAALVALESIDPALRHPDTAHWDWRGILDRFRSNLTCMRVAIWNQVIVEGQQRNTLHALAIGRTTSTRKAVCIEAMESFPFGNHPFCGEVLSIVTRFAGAYGAVMGAEYLRLINPAPGLIEYYSRAGFAVDNTQSNLCMMQIIAEE